MRQKWAAVWPHLTTLPAEGLRVLDAGCGWGQWALELAARRPGWQIIGVDREADAIAQAEAARARLGLTNVQFVEGDFRNVPLTPRSFDLVLSVASAHYLAADGEGVPLFQRFAGWLTPDTGLLCLLVPRIGEGAPFWKVLAHPAWHRVFTSADLADLCGAANLRIETLAGRIGPLGILAKQIAWTSSARSALLHAVFYPIECLVSACDLAGAGERRQTLMWLVLARPGAAVRR